MMLLELIHSTIDHFYLPLMCDSLVYTFALYGSSPEYLGSCDTASIPVLWTITSNLVQEAFKHKPSLYLTAYKL